MPDSLNQWTAVDRYFEDLLGLHDPALRVALEASAAAGLPRIQISPAQGKLLQVLAQAIGARRILEIGTLGGYSAIWLARALPPGGLLISLELDFRHAEVARASLTAAGLEKLTDVRVGPASDSLAALVAESAEPFDFVFIDADKQSYPAYLEYSIRLTRPGGLIVADNVVRDGRIVDAESSDREIRAVREFLDRLAEDPRIDATAVQTVGAKGYDGFSIAVVLGPESQ